MKPLHRSITGLLLALYSAGSPATSEAQHATPSPATPSARERLGVGVAVTGVLGALPFPIVSARISVPMGTGFGLDADAGSVFGTKRLDKGQVPTGSAAALHVRWMHSGRRPSGWSGYLFAGPLILAAQNIDVDGQVTNHKPMRLVEWGYGVDRLMKNGWRAGAELGGAGGEGPFFFVSGFLLWGRK